MNLLRFLIGIAFDIMYWLIIIRALISWFAPNIHDPNWRKILKFLYDITEPILSPIRRLLPDNRWGIDFSPLIAIIALRLIQGFLFQLLYYLRMDLGI